MTTDPTESADPPVAALPQNPRQLMSTTEESFYYSNEVHFLSKTQLEALIEALHKMVQRKLPITMVGAGLPQIAELAGDAKSYAERLVKFPAIDNLRPSDAKAALSRLARTKR